jgi:phytoene dehydrogenase-like protein
MTDVATPLTFWRNARSWRGAFEGWLPTPESFFGQVDKTLPGLNAFFMAGQWVEPGGDVPSALLSGATRFRSPARKSVAPSRRRPGPEQSV